MYIYLYAICVSCILFLSDLLHLHLYSNRLNQRADLRCFEWTSHTPGHVGAAIGAPRGLGGTACGVEGTARGRAGFGKPSCARVGSQRARRAAEERLGGVARLRELKRKKCKRSELFLFLFALSLCRRGSWWRFNSRRRALQKSWGNLRRWTRSS